VNSAIAVSPEVPNPFYDESEKLGAEITELCSYIYAATYRLLTLIREFDEKDYWGMPGLVSCAHWLNFKCGIGMNAAREKVRVAHALKDLPQISEAFRRGQLSYSKVRAMTRIADASNEDYLMMIAKHGTAHHVEKLVSKYRRCKRLQDVDNANQQHAKRELHCTFDDDGSVIIRGRLPAEQGALIMKALELAMDRAGTSMKAAAAARIAADARADGSRVTAETSAREPFHCCSADALAEIAETYLNSEPGDASTADRYQVVLHVTAETLESVQTDAAEVACNAGSYNARPGNAGSSVANSDSVKPKESVARGQTRPDVDINAYLDQGPHVTAETSRRIACDASIVRLIEDEDGEPLSIGRKSRVIPPAMRRALRSRDEGCCFPGCTNTSYIDGHHIEHWADGGETSLDNLVQLCRRHHRLVHEGGFACEKDPNGPVTFRDARHQTLGTYVLPTPLPDDATIEDWMVSHMQDVEIDETTCVPNWMAGDKMDWDLAVGHLFLN
jgi:hypothetical protein